MPELQRPSTAVAASYAEAVAELRAAGETVFPAVDDAILADPDRRAAFVAWLREGRVPIPESGVVAATMFWWVAGDRWLGRIDVRHTLTDALRLRGGHVGYEVRPSQRRRGHARAMLAAVLPHVAALGIDPALLTCDVGNTTSRRIITEAGGGLLDQVGDTLRFALPTGPARRSPGLLAGMTRDAGDTSQ